MGKPFVSVTVDIDPLAEAAGRVAGTVTPHTLAAARATALAIQRTARGIVARRTGATAEGIIVREDYYGTGYIVATSDVLSDAEIYARQRSTNRNIRRRRDATYTQDDHVGLWLEGGTRQGKPRSHTSAPRPFLLPAVELEYGDCERRMTAAVEQGVRDLGFGVE